MTYQVVESGWIGWELDVLEVDVGVDKDTHLDVFQVYDHAHDKTRQLQFCEIRYVL